MASGISLGGRVDDEETLLEALQREVFEETGLRIAQARLFGVFSDPSRIISYPDGNVCRLFSVAFRVAPEMGSEPIPSAESLELRFVTLGELRELDFWRVARPIRDALLAGPSEIVVDELCSRTSAARSAREVRIRGQEGGRFGLEAPAAARAAEVVVTPS